VDAFDAPLDGMRAAAGSMWFANERGELIEIDPATNEVIETYAVADGGCPASLAVVDTHLWYLPQCGSSTLTEVDAETGSVVRTVSVPADSVGLDAGLGAIWVVGMAGELTKVDPETATVVATASIGSAGDRVRVGTKAVFVRLDAVRLVRVDPESLEVEAKYDRFPSAQIPGGGLVVTDDDVWVINFAAGNVMRIPADG
jgi:streptogramin lyase